MRRPIRNLYIAPALLALSAGCGGASTPTTPPTTDTAVPRLPATPARPVTNVYHGVEVVDPYQWLEADTPEVQAWAAAQNADARAHLDHLPNLPELQQEISQIMLDPSPSYGAPIARGGKLFVMKRQPPKEQSVLVVFDDPGALDPASERVVVDPTTLDDEGTLAIDWVSPSPDARLVAVSLSSRGSERGDLAIYDVATGARLPDEISHVQNGTAGGGVTWSADGSGFFYTRYPREGERPDDEREFHQQLWFHVLGTPIADDRYELGRELPRIAEISAELQPTTGELLVTVQHGDGGDNAHFLRANDGRWTQLSGFGDGVKAILFTQAGGLIVMSRANAPRGQLLAVAPGVRDLSRAQVIVPEDAELSIGWSFWEAANIAVTENRIFVLYQAGGPTQLRVFDHQGRRQPDPPVPEVAGVGPLAPIAGDEILFGQQTFVEPFGWHRYRAGEVERLDAISKPALVDLSDAVVVRELAVSKDGTRVPVNIVHAKDHPMDGSRPCIVNGYGGYGVSLAPGYRPLIRPFLDRKVCYAVANLRGGGEFGEEWHKAGSLTHKQNVFDDFAAVLEHMVARGYTAHERLGIIGGSNGGLLMGATLTQHPELVRAVVSMVGIYDTLRVELSPNGEFNVTEFGTVADEAQFRALYAYSPYHHVDPQTAYPAILLTHGDNDPRVSPWQSRKMAARLQSATISSHPILLRTSDKSGHGAGNLSESVSLMAHAWAFLLYHLGA